MHWSAYDCDKQILWQKVTKHAMGLSNGATSMNFFVMNVLFCSTEINLLCYVYVYYCYENLTVRDYLGVK